MKGVTIRVESVYDEKKQHKCSQKNDLKNHMKSVHEGKQPQKCSICSHSFSTNSLLRRHLKSVHEQEKPLLSALSVIMVAQRRGI